jgi:hypothetical protein
VLAAFTVPLWHDPDVELERNATNPEPILYQQRVTSDIPFVCSLTQRTEGPDESDYDGLKVEDCRVSRGIP